MESREVLLKYVKNFRLECHFLLDYASGSKGMPLDTYNRAHRTAKEEVVEEFDLNDELKNKIDALHRTFISKVIELENYNYAEEYILNVIEKL